MRAGFLSASFAAVEAVEVDLAVVVADFSAGLEAAVVAAAGFAASAVVFGSVLVPDFVAALAELAFDLAAALVSFFAVDAALVSAAGVTSFILDASAASVLVFEVSVAPAALDVGFFGFATIPAFPILVRTPD